MDQNDSLSRLQAATAIFTEHGGFIRTTIGVHAHRNADIEDLYQEFFLELIRKPVPADVENVKGYLFRAIGHHVVNTIRRRRTYARKMKKYAIESRISINIEESRNACTDDEQKNATMVRLTRDLQDRQAQALLLKYRDQYNVREIATRMGIKRRTVSRYLFRRACGSSKGGWRRNEGLL